MQAEMPSRAGSSFACVSATTRTCTAMDTASSPLSKGDTSTSASRAPTCFRLTSQTLTTRAQ